MEAPKSMRAEVGKPQKPRHWHSVGICAKHIEPIHSPCGSASCSFETVLVKTCELAPTWSRCTCCPSGTGSSISVGVGTCAWLHPDSEEEQYLCTRCEGLARRDPRPRGVHHIVGVTCVLWFRGDLSWTSFVNRPGYLDSVKSWQVAATDAAEKGTTSHEAFKAWVTNAVSTMSWWIWQGQLEPGALGYCGCRLFWASTADWSSCKETVQHSVGCNHIAKSDESLGCSQPRVGQAVVGRLLGRDSMRCRTKTLARKLQIDRTTL